MFKFVQSGDFHLDSPLEAFETQTSRRLKLLDSFGRVADTVKETNADLLLLTGDVFDNDGIKAETIDYLKAKLSEIPQTKVFVSPGNHDYIGRSSAWTDVQWPDNVYVFSDFESIFLEELGVIVHGAGFKDRTAEETMLPKLAALDTRWVNLLVMHGDITRTSSYNPLDIEELAHFDYCALGHRHEFQKTGTRQHIVYAGNPCARNFLETGVKGCVVGTYEKGVIKTEFRPFDFPSFHNIVLDVTGYRTNAQVRELIENTVSNEKDYYRITLTGRNNIEHDTGYLAEAIDAGSLEVLDETKYLRNYEALKEEPTLQGEFTRRMLELSDRDPLAMAALDAGLDALEDEK